MQPINLLIDPVYTTIKISRCSTFWEDCCLADRLCQKYQDTRVTCIIPSKESLYTVDHERLFAEFPSMEKWNYLPIYIIRDRYREHWFQFKELYDIVNFYNGTYGDWDVCLTNKNNSFFYRDVSGLGKINRSLYLLDTFPFLPFKKTTPGSSALDGVGKYLSQQTLANYLYFDNVQVPAGFERDGILSTAKLFFLPSQISRLEKRVLVAHNTPSTFDKMYPLSEQAREYFINSDEVCLLYAQKITEGQRRFSMIYKSLKALYAKLAASGINLNIGICTQSASGMPTYAKNDANFLSFVSLPRLEFWEKLRHTHIQISFSIEEDTPKGILEGLLLGVIPVIPKKPWSIDLFGNDYIFFANSISESYGLVSWICKNKAEAWDKFISWYKDYFIPVICSRDNAKDLFVSCVESYIKNNINIIKCNQCNE